MNTLKLILVYVLLTAFAITPTTTWSGTSCEDLFSAKVDARFDSSEKIPPRKISLEEETLGILDRLVLSKDQTGDELKLWVARLQERKLSVLEHTALSFIYRSELVGNLPEGRVVIVEIEKTLRNSWMHLTGFVPILSDRLPADLEVPPLTKPLESSGFRRLVVSQIPQEEDRPMKNAV